MAFSGLTDVDAAARAAKQLRTQATAITSLSGAISGIISRLHGAGWVGGDATQFATNDWPKARKQFATLGQAITGLADELDRQIAEQAEASKADPSTTATGGGGADTTQVQEPVGPIYPDLPVSEPVGLPDGDTPDGMRPSWWPFNWWFSSYTPEPWEAEQRTVLANSGWSEHTQVDLIRQVYLLPDDYRAVFLEHLGELSYVQNASGFYTSSTQTVSMDMAEDPNDPRGPFYTFFHETGHGVDDLEDPTGGFLTRTYTNDQGQTLHDTLVADVRADLTDTVQDFSNDPAQQTRVVDAIINHDTANLAAADQTVLTALQTEYAHQLRNHNVASDIYGGITDNVIRANWGHDDPNYWYDTQGNSTGRQELEFFAGAFAEQAMPGRPDTSLYTFFPTSAVFVEDMVHDMATN
ncbi:MAG: hypothetical protein LBR19_00940 [Bifidobacteriaceae bacterium]|jgi:hypothetical protein|nr:hypothetical protein [Bifidobacteriaceae bacterium]